ncbi:MAG: Appr-1-p processing protein [Candidatus Cloacimonetes bacterium]|nr:Appr-1-p processing protein [Candidatus Cloacimonadota bacterium]
MIEIIERNILNNTSGIICHQVNCFTMGKGLAGDIRIKYPIVYEEFINTLNQNKSNLVSLLGGVLYVPVNESLVIANLFAQYNYRKYNDNSSFKYTDYTMLSFCLDDVKNYALKVSKDVHIPFEIGCGLGGGNWNIVYSIIDKIFSETNINCYINKFRRYKNV